MGCLHKARAEVGKSSQELTLIGVRDIVAWIGGCGEHFGFVLSGRADGSCRWTEFEVSEKDRSQG